MRNMMFAVVLLLLGVSYAPAQNPAPLINPVGPGDAQNALPPDAGVDQVLDALEESGRNLEEFTAKVSLESGDPFVGGLETRSGQVKFQKLDKDDGRIHVNLDKVQRGNKIINEKIEYVFKAGELTDRDYHKKSETRRQVLKPGEKMNLFRLGEGPFPLPIGQKKEDVRKLFDVTLVPTAGDADALPDTIHLQLKPLKGTPYARRFGLIEVWVHRKTRFPVQVKTSARDGTDVRTTRLQDVKVNPKPGLDQGDFDLPVLPDPENWNIHSEPYKE